MKAVKVIVNGFEGLFAFNFENVEQAFNCVRMYLTQEAKVHIEVGEIKISNICFTSPCTGLHTVSVEEAVKEAVSGRNYSWVEFATMKYPVSFTIE